MKFSSAAALSALALSAGGADAQTLAGCRAACRGGSVAWNAFCGAIPVIPPWLIPVKGACWGFGYALNSPPGVTACSNWCYWWWGDGLRMSIEGDLRAELIEAGINPDDIDFETGEQKEVEARAVVEETV